MFTGYLMLRDNTMITKIPKTSDIMCISKKKRRKCPKNHLKTQRFLPQKSVRADVLLVLVCGYNY